MVDTLLKIIINLLVENCLPTLDHNVTKNYHLNVDLKISNREFNNNDKNLYVVVKVLSIYLQLKKTVTKKNYIKVLLNRISTFYSCQ